MNTDKANIENYIDKIKRRLGIETFKECSGTMSFGNISRDTFTQEDIIRASLSGADTLAVLPTGMGKSYCYMGPAICREGLTIVVTPLVSLMKDQVKQFNNKNRSAEQSIVLTDNLGENGQEQPAIEKYRAIHPGMGNASIDKMFKEISHPKDSSIKYKLLYVSPERLSNEKFLRTLEKYEEAEKLCIEQIVVDEAHCISQWAFQFRESYLYIKRFIDNRPNRPVVSAFTATATPRDIIQIESILGFSKKPRKKYGKFTCFEIKKDRELNIIKCGEQLNVQERNMLRSKEKDGSITKDESDLLKPYRFQQLIKILNEFADNREHLYGKCIVYCSTVVQVERLYDALNDRIEVDDATLHENVLGIKPKTYKLSATKVGRKELRSKIAMRELKPHITRRHNANPSFKKMRITKYHGQMSKLERDKALDAFSGKQYQVIIATIAFGMGIDINNIRVVVHYDIPASIEDYIQEIGRSGRGDQRSRCYLLVSAGRAEIRDYGSMRFAITWMLTSKFANTETGQALVPRFSDETKEVLHFLRYYRMAQMWDFCMNSENLKSSEKQEQLYRYLQETTIDNQLLKRFYAYLRKTLVSDTSGSKFIQYMYKVDSKNVDTYVPPYDAKNDAKYIKEYLGLLSEANYLHINNTKIANFLRWNGNSIAKINWDRQGFYKYGSIDGWNVEEVLPEEVNYNSLTRRKYSTAINEWKRRDRLEYATLLKSDFEMDAAFINVADAENPKLDKYVNYAWQKQSKGHRKNADLIFVVQYERGMNFVVKKIYEKNYLSDEECEAANISKEDYSIKGFNWVPLDTTREGGEALYNRYIGRESSVGTLFTKEANSDWRAFRFPKNWEDELLKRNAGEYDLIGKPDAYFNLSGEFRYVKGRRSRDISFSLSVHNADIPSIDYFDMAIIDAIYSLNIVGKKEIFIKNIWEVLCGDINAKFSRSSSERGTDNRQMTQHNQSRAEVADEYAIRKRIEKLRMIYIAIDDPNTHGTNRSCSGQMLELEVKWKKYRNNKRVPYYVVKGKSVSPLFTYAETINGEIIKVPVHLLNVKNIPYGLKSSLDYEVKIPEGAEIWLPKSSGMLLDNRFKVIKDEKPGCFYNKEGYAVSRYYEAINEKNTHNRSAFAMLYRNDERMKSFSILFSKGDQEQTDEETREIISTEMIEFPQIKMRSSLGNVLLMHYIVHRISIARESMRGEYLRIDTVRDILNAYLTDEQVKDNKYLKLRINAILLYLRRMQYMKVRGYILRNKIPVNSMEYRNIALFKPYNMYIVSFDIVDDKLKMHIQDSKYVLDKGEYVDISSKQLRSMEKEYSEIDFSEFDGYEIDFKRGTKKKKRKKRKAKAPVLETPIAIPLVQELQECDIDRAGNVAYTGVMRWIEAGRSDFLTQLEYSYDTLEEKGIILSNLEVTCNINPKVRVDGNVSINVSIREYKRGKVTFEYKINNTSGKTVVKAETQHSLINSEGKIISVNKQVPELHDALKKRVVRE